ncbi:TetR/AcrR family transcriptional regulator [Nocardia uniformis]|uniref:TetR/AcrR family transcriptional regulator n=1 Tax=Nocardia uniformis TaxID=53432 RepID=A0A849BRR6_9NOCA|nr:TetR/AcrR family transcriptional regulator [Nocardia uniformis]NNH68804.1 TetR/AcrR family transcriptional regulator [Nocardia uniformis]
MAARDGKEAPLPKSVALLWGLGGSGARGPKRGLSLDQIVEAAIAVADEEGFGALSMSRVAERLGFTTMSLYRYVDNKDSLLELLSDRAVGLPPDIAAGTPWRTALETWAWAEFHAIRRHPWWLDIPMQRPPVGPNSMAWLENALVGLAETRIPDSLKLQLVLNLSLYVVGRVRFLKDLTGGGEGEEYSTVLERVLDPEQYPELTKAIGQQVFGNEINWEEMDFSFALDRLLDGYAQFLDTQSG